MEKMFESGLLEFRGGQCIDLYNMQVLSDVFVTVTTRIDQCNHYWTTEVYEND